MIYGHMGKTIYSLIEIGLVFIDYFGQSWDFRQPLLEIFNTKIQEYLYQFRS
jgi:hypothetical protein